VDIISWIIVGFIAGWLTGLVMKGSGYGCVGNVLLGVIGGLAGGFMASAFFDMRDTMTGFNWQSILTAFFGAVAVTVVVRLLRRI